MLTFKAESYQRIQKNKESESQNNKYIINTKPVRYIYSSAFNMKP